MAGGLLCLLALLALQRTLPETRPDLVQVSDMGTALPAQREQVQLVGFELGPNAEWLERPSFAEVTVGETASERYEAILAALQDALPGLWPGELPQPAVVVAGDSSGAETVVLDFTLALPVAVSVQEEEALLKTLETTLRRNGAEAVRVLVNHRPSASFLGHVKLEQALE